MAFVATFGGSAGYRLVKGRLRRAWQSGNGGSSPVIAGGLVWIYDPGGALRVYRPRSGKLVRSLAVPGGHWNSPIVAGSRVYLPTGDANDQSTGGSLSIFHR